MARVLIVDDDEMDRLLLRRILAGAGHELFFAKNGEEGLKSYLRSGIDVIVSDIEMPGSDGLELIESISALGMDVRIVVVSGKGDDVLSRAKAMGAHVTLAKPVDPAELLAAVSAGSAEPEKS
jgi:CheY-like chemotaxis protein